MTVQLSFETVQEIWQDTKKKISKYLNCSGGESFSHKQLNLCN